MISQIFSFKGRLSRLGYVAYYLPGMGMMAVATFGLQAYSRPRIASAEETLVLMLLWMVIVVAFIAFAAGSARRFHDIGWSAWWIVFGLASLFVLIWTRSWVPQIAQQAIPVLLLLAPGQTGANRYGAAPATSGRFNPRPTLTR